MKKKISVVLLLIIVVTCGLTLIGCERQRKVEIVLYHPITGEEIGDVSLIEFEEGEIPEKTKVKFAFRDIKNGKLLTDEDLEPYSSLETCCRVNINIPLGGGMGTSSPKDQTIWPTEEGKYNIHFWFNSVDNTDGNYERRYATAWADYTLRIGEQDENTKEKYYDQSDCINFNSFIIDKYMCNDIHKYWEYIC